MVRKLPKRRAGEPVHKALRSKIVRRLRPPLSQPNAQIAREVGVTQGTVAKIRREIGIRPRRTGENSVQIPHNVRAELIRRLKEPGRPGDQTIADALGISKGTVATQRRKLGIPSYGSGGQGTPIDGSPAARERLDQADQIRRLREALKESMRAATNDQTLRQAVFGLVEDPPAPVSFQMPRLTKGKHDAETVVVMLSDLQWGEVVKLDAMDGLNSFSVAIARKRLERAFTGAIDLSTEHWAGPPPARVIVILGGDMISGEIHNELERYNELLSIPAAKDCSYHVAAGLDLLVRALPPNTPIDVISIPGNHGRTTPKYQSKGYAETSYDTLISDFVEMLLVGPRGPGGSKQIRFFRPMSGDGLFNIYNWLFLVTHGDRTGSRGGQGFIGPAAVAARGYKKLVMDYSARGYRVDFILSGHLHTGLELEEGFVNGTLVGPSQFSRDQRYRPKPATQLFLAVHRARGISQARRLQVGAPEEGTLYTTPPLQDLERGMKHETV